MTTYFSKFKQSARPVFAILITLITLTPLLGYGEVAPKAHKFQATETFRNHDQFLRSLGFEDYAGRATQTLNDNKNLTQVSAYALKITATRLTSVNSARNIGDFVYYILNRLDQQNAPAFNRKLEILVEAASQQSRFFPQISQEPLDKNLYHDVTANLIASTKDKLYRERAQDRHFTEKLNLLRALIYVAEPKNKAEKDELTDWLDDQLFDTIYDSYGIGSRQQNRFLGRALVISLVRFARENQLSSLETNLAKKLLANDVYLANIVGGRYQGIDKNGRSFDYPLKSGQLAYEYSHGQEAYFTSLLIRPTTTGGRALAARYDLISSLWHFNTFKDRSEFYRTLEKKEADEELTTYDKKVYESNWNPDLAKGFSHVGMFEVRQNAALNISVSWIWDIFPESNESGVVRLMTLEGFAYPERHLKMGILTYDATKFQQEYRRQLGTRGYKEIVWNSYESRYASYVKGGYGPTVEDSGRFDWLTKISAADVQALAAVPDSQAQVWFDNQVVPRVLYRIHQYLYGNEAKVFAAGLINARDMLHCSQLIEMAFLEAINMDVEPDPNDVMLLGKIFSDKLSEFIKLDPQDRIISPNSLIWQDKLMADLYTVYLNRDRVTQTWKNSDSSIRLTNAQAYTVQLERFPELKTVQLDEDHLSLLAIENIEVVDYEN